MTTSTGRVSGCHVVCRGAVWCIGCGRIISGEKTNRRKPAFRRSLGSVSWDAGAGAGKHAHLERSCWPQPRLQTGAGGRDPPCALSVLAVASNFAGKPGLAVPGNATGDSMRGQQLRGRQHDRRARRCSRSGGGGGAPEANGAWVIGLGTGGCAGGGRQGTEIGRRPAISDIMGQQDAEGAARQRQGGRGACQDRVCARFPRCCC